MKLSQVIALWMRTGGTHCTGAGTCDGMPLALVALVTVDDKWALQHPILTPPKEGLIRHQCPYKAVFGVSLIEVIDGFKLGWYLIPNP